MKKISRSHIRGLKLNKKITKQASLSKTEIKIVNYLKRHPLASVFELYFCAKIDKTISMDEYENILDSMIKRRIVSPLNIYEQRHGEVTA